MKLIEIKDSKNNQIINIDKKDKYIVFFNNYSGEVEVNLKAKGAEVYILGVYIGKGSADFSLKTKQNHIVSDTYSDLLVKGVFFDKSKFLYEGLIRIEKGAQRSHAYQKNQNLTLSKNVYVESRPFLEIKANDVFCTHGSTTGGLNHEEIYYLNTRGLTQKKAKQVLIEGFINEVFDKQKPVLDKVKKRIISNL
ncbi:MAG: hypothetical protein KatS3mg090_0888 [Patescibacteria group bacterium]|nr:MAG: hypothetical protein KatS3mg090_0888 [Patescibacteria group bacterium]